MKVHTISLISFLVFFGISAVLVYQKYENSKEVEYREYLLLSDEYTCPAKANIGTVFKDYFSDSKITYSEYEEIHKYCRDFKNRLLIDEITKRNKQ